MTKEKMKERENGKNHKNNSVNNNLIKWNYIIKKQTSEIK